MKTKSFIVGRDEESDKIFVTTLKPNEHETLSEEEADKRIHWLNDECFNKLDSHELLAAIHALMAFVAKQSTGD